MINRVKCAVRFSLVSLTAMPVEKGGVALMQSTVDDGKDYDWLHVTCDIMSCDSNDRSRYPRKVMSIRMDEGSEWVK